MLKTKSGHPEITVIDAASEQGKSRLYSAMAALIVLVCALVIGWLLLKFVEVLIPIAAAVVLVLAFVYIAFDFVSPRLKYSKEDEGKTRRQQSLDAYNRKLKPGQVAMTAEELTKFEKIAVLGVGAVFLFFYVLITLALADFALNPNYQQYPLNLWGFIVVVLSVWSTLRILPNIYRYFRDQDKPVKNRSWWNYLLSKADDLVTGGYILAVFLVMFGILK